MKQMKHLLIYGLFSFLGIGLSFAFSSPSVDFYYETNTPDSINHEVNTEYGQMIKQTQINEKTSLLNQLLSVFNLDGEEYHGPQKAFYYIQKILNYALSFVTLIAFGLLIYGFYGMLIGDGDKQFSKVKATLKGIAIAILVMGLAWLIVSMLFWVYQNKVYTP